jgi:pimeloyl-ACP methyl ester carboxylesterase
VATYVLVHGAWTGAHGFHKVRPLLRAGGHEVFTPSLTGIGERAHLVSPQIGLSTHVQDVVNTVLYEDLTDITLLGFSYGGMVVTGAIATIADRVRHLVFLDAFVPGHGESLEAIVGRPPWPANEVGAEWLVPPAPRQSDDPAEATWSERRRTPQPVRCFTEPVELSQPLEDYSFTRTYIKATADAATAPGADALWAAAHRAEASPVWRYREIATSHMIALNRPVQLTELLLELT